MVVTNGAMLSAVECLIFLKVMIGCALLVVIIGCRVYICYLKPIHFITGDLLFTLVVIRVSRKLIVLPEKLSQLMTNSIVITS